MEKQVRIRKNIFGRWILVHPVLDDAAWSGSRWVSVGKDGISTDLGGIQISNLATQEEAVDYAARFGFTVAPFN